MDYWSKKIVRDVGQAFLSAVRDGLEIPGEVGRWSIADIEDVDREIWAYRMATHGAIEFIALRKEGTGKEEERDGAV